MSQFHFSSGLDRDTRFTTFYKRRDHRTIASLVKELTWGEVSLEKLGEQMRYFSPSFHFPLTEFNCSDFAVAIVGLVCESHNLLAGEGLNPTAYRLRSHGTFSNSEILSLYRLLEEYQGLNLFKVLESEGFYLVRVTRRSGNYRYWYPTRNRYYIGNYAYKIIGDEIRAAYPGSYTEMLRLTEG